MDLTDIMDFLNEMNDGPELNAAEKESLSAQLDSASDLSPQQRSRANTWHGNRSIVKSEPPSSPGKEGGAASVDCSPRENYAQSGNKHLGVEHSSSTVFRKSISRRNAWGNFSYADMITKAINSSPDKRMTLSEIYNWMVQNIPFFKDKGDTNSSAGWKNSIRHNLSLHSCFMRMQNEGTGKSSWWMINPDYKATKLPRRRAVTMDNSKAMSLHQRKQKATKKTDSLGNSDSSGGTISKSRSSSSDLNFVELKPEAISCEDVFLPQDFRPRSNSNSLKTLRLSPAFEDDDLQEQIASWPVSETFHMGLQQQDFGENQDYLTQVFQASTSQLQLPKSTSAGPISILKTAVPVSLSSLSTPFNLPQGWNYDGRDQTQFLKQEDYKNARASEHLLMSGGGLVTAEQNSIIRNLPPQLWTSDSLSGTPLLRDYLSRDDFGANSNSSNPVVKSDGAYHQKLYSGGRHEVGSCSPSFVSSPANAGSSWQQQHQQATHGLLLQLLTDNSQQQITERRNSPIHQVQTFSCSPTNQSMLQHLLTVRQKSRRQIPGVGRQRQYHQHLPTSRHLPPSHHPLERGAPSQRFFEAVPANQSQFQLHGTQQHIILPHVLQDSSHFVQQTKQQQFSADLQQGSQKSGELFNSIQESNIPRDLDFSLLELDSSADIECNIDQVIDHEKKFGEPWDFNFDDDFLLDNKKFHESIK